MPSELWFKPAFGSPSSTPLPMFLDLLMRESSIGLSSSSSTTNPCFSKLRSVDWYFCEDSLTQLFVYLFVLPKHSILFKVKLNLKRFNFT